MIRVERHILGTSNPYFGLLDDVCFRAKNLYNHALYEVRQALTKGEFLWYSQLDKILKNDEEYPDYRALPAQTSQQVLKKLEKNLKSYQKAWQEYKKNPSKFNAPPKLPNYKKKNGRSIAILTNQQVKLKDGRLKFPKYFDGFSLKTKVDNVRELRIIPHFDHIIIEVVYQKEEVPKMPDNGAYLGIDIGVDNLAAATSNTGLSVLVSGKSLKSQNQFFNKKKAHFQSVAKQMNDKKMTKRIRRLTDKRNRKIDDYLHKASKYIVDLAISNNINTIVVGKNDGWKQKSKMSKRVNQNFVQIPHARFIQMLEYKCENAGLNFVLTEESYTSGTSFLDGEAPTRENYDKSRRVKRGLFKSNTGKLINADTNASLQMIKKAFPKVKTDGIEAVVLQPVRVDVLKNTLTNKCLMAGVSNVC